MPFFFYQKNNTARNHTYSKKASMSVDKNFGAITIFNVKATVEEIKIFLCEDSYAFSLVNFEQAYNQFIIWSMKNAFKNVFGYKCEDFMDNPFFASLYPIIAHSLERDIFRMSRDMGDKLNCHYNKFYLFLKYDRLYVHSC